jgi:signal transduction histidine kinase/DNA-binding response OmpR family regulator
MPLETEIPAQAHGLTFLAGGGEMGALIRAHDWAATPLGPPDQWPQSLRTALRIMLTSRQPIWIGWGDALIYFYNDAYKSIIGGKHPWALGRPTEEVWREIWSDIGPMLATALEGVEGTYVEEQLLIMERNGYPEETYYTFSYSPIPDDTGAPGGIICANTADTERVIGERQLALLRELSARTLEARSWPEACVRSVEALSTDAHDITFAALYEIVDDGARAVLCATTGLEAGHPAAPEALDMRTADPWPVAGFNPSEGALRVSGLDARFADLPRGRWDRPSHHAVILALPAASDTGRAGLLIVGLNPYRLFDDNYRGFLGLVAGQIAAAAASGDAYAEERRRSEALADLDRAKTAFFSNISHEFRTPLTLMLGPLEDALSSSETIEGLKAHVELAHRNGARLLRLVNSLLDFSRIEAGRVQARFEPTDFAQFTTDVASSFRSAFDKAGLRLDLHADPLPQLVYVDREMWEKVVLNLLSNAFKFTLEGGVSVRIGVRDGAALLEVRDTGIGIAQAELPRLFERFHRVEGAQGRSFEGSGIGLALVHELVRLHGGEITAQSREGEGTAFFVRLPFGRAHLRPEQVQETDAPEARAVRSQEFLEEAIRWLPEEARQEASAQPHDAVRIQDRRGAGKYVLLADDNADMRAYVGRLLAAQGYEIEAVGDGMAALEAARRRHPDLILTDVMMPRLDGFAFLRQLRADPALASVPVIMLSARAGEEAKVEGLEAGADDYLVKPFPALELIARVNANVQMAEVRRDAERAIWRSERQMRISEERLGIALATGRVGIYEWEVDSDSVAVLGPLAELYGVDPDSAATAGLPLTSFLAGIHADDRSRVRAAITKAAETGAPLDVEYRVVGGLWERNVVARGVTRTTPEGARFLAGAIIDVTEDRAAQQLLATQRVALEEQAQALTILNRAAAAVAGDLDQQRLVQTITDAAVEVTGAEFGAFFYNLIDEAGESYTLYTLSGAPREAFEKFPMPRNTPVFGPTFVGEAVVRSDDITKDPRYGRMEPYRGMPEGHLPVRSYLAVPVRSRSGEVIGGLFFGHSAPGTFDERSEERVVGLASQAAIALDNARLFLAAQRELDQRRRAEAELQALNATLSERVAAAVAERATAEEALRQAQKMEAVGQLTGGVAHDFNNLLTVIIGGLDTIRRSSPEDTGRIQRATSMALQGAERAAALTERLLAFSRRQPLQPKPLDLNARVRGLTDLLHRSLGERIELEGVLAPRLWTIEADPNQLETAIINLAVNARDAMPDGGKLTIETFNAALDESYRAVDSEVIPGQYAVISVSDSGQGMSQDTLNRVFEPFFTTKEVGRGTGLGLSMVYGFVKQSGGHITIYSEPGEGTAVRLYFPRYRGATAHEIEAEALPLARSSAGEVVLAVEDNHEVRAYSVMILHELGYEVLEAADAEHALAILRSDARVDLLFTDVVLPGQSGRALVDAALELRPGLKVLYTTGYSRNAIVHHGRLDAGVELISKPFTYEQLAARVRDVLDR